MRSARPHHLTSVPDLKTGVVLGPSGVAGDVQRYKHPSVWPGC